MNSDHRNQLGNAALETVLFLPIALFFLFVAIDVGLCLIQRASIKDDFRSTLNSVASYAKPLLQKGGADLSRQELEMLAESISNELNTSLARTYRLVRGAQDDKSSYATRVSIYSIEISSESGNLEAGTLDEVYQLEEPPGGLQQLAELVSAAAFIEEGEYVNAVLDSDTGLTTSRFAQAVGFLHAPEGRSADQFRERSLLLYLEVRAIPQGINLDYVDNILGRFLSIQQQNLELIRLQ